jgi:WD40 repeat protein
MVGGEALWAPDGQHFAVISSGSGDSNVYIFDKAGTWVGEAPAWEAAWSGDDTLIVLPYDPTSNNDFATAYIAHIGYNGLGTMLALPGRYEFLYGNGNGTVALQTAQGYAVWRNGSLLPEVVGDGPISISSDGSLMAFQDQSSLRVVTTDDGKEVRSWPGLPAGPHPQASFSPDGRHLLVTDFAYPLQSLVVLNVSDGKKTTMLTGTAVYRGTWVGNDRIFAVADAGAWWLVSLDGARTRLGNGGTAYRDGAISTQGWAALVPEASLGTVEITRSGKTSTVALPSPATGLYWSPDGTELVVTCNPDVLGRDAQVVLLRP